MSEEKKDTKKKSLLIIVVVALAALIGLGFLGKVIYGKIAEKFFGQNVKVENDSGKVTVKTEEGTLSVQEGGKVPDGFPKDFPVYPQATLTGSWSAQGEKGEGVSVVWETEDSADKVSTYFGSELPKQGWKVTSTFSAKESTTLSFEKETAAGFIGVTRNGDKTAISVSVNTGKNQ